jgi:hypothetical protein
VPLTLMLMMVMAQFGSTKWIAASLSNDGKYGDVKEVDKTR